MSDQTPAPAPPERPRGRFRRAHDAFENWYKRIHRFDRRKRREHQAHFYALAIAIGVPLMSWLVHDFFIKLAIACVWFGFAPAFYFWLQGVELESQIKRYGLLDQEESDYQRRKMFYLYYGVIFAFVLWLVTLAVYVAAEWPGQGGFVDTRFVLGSIFHTPVYYGLIEWGMLAHTMLVGFLCIDVYYPLITNYLQATAGQRRLEEGVVAVTPPKQ